MGACPDTCGWRRTCPPKPSSAPPARRSASLRRGFARRDGARRFRFSHPAERKSGRCRSLVRGRPPSRSVSTSASLREKRSSFVGLRRPPGISVGELIRARALDRHVVSRTDATTIRELRRLGGLLKKVHLDSGGAYSRETASVDRPPRGDRPACWRRRKPVVIVKKVGTSKTVAPKSKASNVRALIDYIAGLVAGGDGEKVEHRGAFNLLNIDHDGQVQEMVDLAEVVRRSPQPVQHWILSWREGEQPTRAQADEAVGMFLAEMGLGEHQAVYALHRDTHNCHVHVAVNRVHPTTEKLVTVNNGFDLEVAHRAIASIEQRQGWEREARGLYVVGADGRAERLKPRNGAERQPSGRARDIEERTGQRSAQRTAIEEAAPIVRQARSWRELHDALAARGMRFEKKGSGALLWIGEKPVKVTRVEAGRRGRGDKRSPGGTGPQNLNRESGRPRESRAAIVEIASPLTRYRPLDRQTWSPSSATTRLSRWNLDGR
jgi:hypothetical protein